MSIVQVGDEAPDFDLPALIAGVKKGFHLAEQRGKKNIVLAFYPSNWEPVSDRQMMAYQLERQAFSESGTETVAVCVDSIMNTTAWEREIGPFDFPMCSDFWPHGEVAQRYGVLRSNEPARGASERAVFVIDLHGRVAFRRTYDIAELPDLAEVLNVVRRIRAA